MGAFLGTLRRKRSAAEMSESLPNISEAGAGRLDGTGEEDTQTSERPSKRQRIVTDLSDRAIQLCAQDAILAVHRRAVG